MTDITIFSGHAHREFAEEMCAILGLELSASRLSRFSNDCLQVQLRANCRRRDVYIVQPLVPPVQENLMELLMMVDAARGASADHVTVVMPHYAYARSDKKDAPRISIGGGWWLTCCTPPGRIACSPWRCTPSRCTGSSRCRSTI